jgi:hypothetical protein
VVFGLEDNGESFPHAFEREHVTPVLGQAEEALDHAHDLGRLGERSSLVRTRSCSRGNIDRQRSSCSA